MPATITQYPVLHDDEARPSPPPGPYCVYKLTEQEVLHRSAGPTPHTEHVVIRNLLTFTVHARPVGGLSAKAVAIELATRIMRAYDGNDLDLWPDTMVCLSREGDFGKREDDEQYAWHIPYRITYNTVVSRPVRRKPET